MAGDKPPRYIIKIRSAAPRVPPKLLYENGVAHESAREVARRLATAGSGVSPKAMIRRKISGEPSPLARPPVVTYG